MDFVGGLIALGLVALIIAATVAMASRPRRGGPGSSGFSGMFGAMEEIFAPGRYEARIEQERQQQAPATAPLPGDKPKPGDEIEADGPADRDDGNSPQG
ncbi:hypothetical protein [Arthrobacter sulfonylureivorans]|uniref:Secreted protein n=1 Tax=Arthrobacter sulfonylureivorans TaxID=2486855 RepID=A0ABY3W923_9MICC|nr:hypothetical protein [Arthrobacter sulfonylureivorans]UNK46857.1 hypothetical protein MNQ99_05750 [Arthrobacter sulfonylureivorans]